MTTFLLAHALVFANAQAERPIDARYFRCFQPVDLSAGNVRPLHGWFGQVAHPLLLHTANRRRMTEASLVVLRDSATHEIRLGGLRMSEGPAAHLTRSFARHALSPLEIEQHLLDSENGFQLYTPTLPARVGPEDLREIYRRTSAFARFRQGEMLERYLDAEVASYDGRRLFGWNQVEAAFAADSVWGPLLVNSFSVFEGETIAIVLSGDFKRLALCVDQELDHVVRVRALAELKEWRQSPHIRALLGCGALL